MSAAVTTSQILRDTLASELRRDPSIFLMGEDIAAYGGSFGVTRDLIDEFGSERVRNTPISEAAIVGSAVGYAMSGGRVIAELMYADFIGRAGDEIFNQLSKWQAMSAGILKMPVDVIRRVV